MKTVTLKEINLENYKKFEKVSYQFAPHTKVSGRNGHGKSSLMDAYLDVMTGKLSDGTLPSNVRRKIGEEEVSEPVIREIVLDIDGKETVIRKETKKGKSTSTTKYQVNGFDYNKTKYEEFLKTIANVDAIAMCSTASPLLNELRKSTANVRKNLGDMAGFDTEKFMSEHPEFSEADKLLDGHPVEEAMTKFRKKGTAKRKEVSEKDRDISKAKRESVVVSEELLKQSADLEKEISEVDAEDDKLANLSKAYDSMQIEITGLKRSRDAIASKAAEETREEHQKKASLLYKLKMSKNQKADELGMLKSDVDSLEQKISEYKRQLEEYREEYRKRSDEKWDDTELIRIRGEEFDPEKAVCPTCGQDLPEQQVESLKRSFEFGKQNRIQEQNENKERFEKVKLNTLSEISLGGNRAKSELEKAKSDKEEKEVKIKELKSDIKRLAEEIEKTGEELNSIPEEPDLSENEEYKAVCNEISKKEESLKNLDNGEEQRTELSKKRRELMDKKSSIDAEIRQQEKTKEANEAEIKRLEAERSVLVQEETDVRHKVDILKEFSIAKNEKLAEMINPYFKHFQFKFLDYTQDGDPVEVCRMMVDGIDYMNGLNHSDQILCNIDLVQGLQEMNGLNLPIWVDDVESVNDDRIPDTGRQMILLKVSDGELEGKEC